MQDNLARLDHCGARGGDDNAYRIRELQGMMNARGCDVPGGDLFDASRGDNFLFEPDAPYYSGGGTFRTLCVRTCDGYYFPISFSTTSERFPEDAQTCAGDVPGGGSAALLSSESRRRAGEHDRRSPASPIRRCRPPSNIAPASTPPAPASRPAAMPRSRRSNRRAQPIPEDPTAPLPRARPAPGEDPETLADRAGYFVPTTAAMDAPSGAAMTTSADGQPIRLVGPALGNAAQDALVISPVPN